VRASSAARRPGHPADDDLRQTKPAMATDDGGDAVAMVVASRKG
jgi:hypothetical protein